MFDKLSYPPVRNPSREISRIIEFLENTYQPMPPSSHDKMMNSISGGRTRAKTVEQTAPIKLSSRLRLGTSWAITNVTRTNEVLNKSSPINGLLSANLKELLIDGNMICTATKN